MSKITISVIIPVLNSHEAVRRQVRHLENVMPPFSEIVIVDDGSDPPICKTLSLPETNNVTFILETTQDFRPWTQPRARNIGAAKARGDILAFIDVDHIVSQQAIYELEYFYDDRIDWPRIPASLNARGYIEPAAGEARGPAAGIFAMRRKAFDRLRGFDERFCGEYGFDDLDLLERYNKLAKRGQVSQSVTSVNPVYYWSGETPAFHDLPHEPSTRNVQILSEKANEPVS